MVTMDTFISLNNLDFLCDQGKNFESQAQINIQIHIFYTMKKQTDTDSDARFLMESQEPNSFLIKSNCHDFSIYNEGFFFL